MFHLVGMFKDLDPRYSHLIFETIPHAIFTVNSDGEITSFNRAAEEATGWKRAEVLGRRCREVFKSSHCQHSCFLFESMEEGEPHRDEEVRIVRRDGAELPVSVSTAALHDPDGRMVGGVEMLRDLTVENALRRQLKENLTCDDIVSKSSAMKSVRDLLPLVANSDSTVLIEGEPGTGKELVARAIHNLGPRADGPFVAVNCGALPDTLVESELFGHKRGAFTDAKADAKGRFALAEGGTLLLDEIGDISPAVQVKLLRVLQEREYLPLGGEVPVKANVRILAATNRDLSMEVMNGHFRQDLFFRLNVVRVVLPPLRARWEDVPLLVDHFIAKFNAIQGRRIHAVSERAMATLATYHYPGNVRELENAIEHAFVVCAGSIIRQDDLPPHIVRDLGHRPHARHAAAQPTINGNGPRPLENAEAAAIRDALERNGLNRSRAAADLGVSRSSLWRKLMRHRWI
jgi:PAS domain S-box-containing protein